MKIRERLILPDVWRGVAVIAMVLYHAVFLGWYRFGWSVNVLNGPWRLIGWFGGGSFLVLAGWSAWLRHQRAPSAKNNLHQALRRTTLIAAAAVGISIFTLLFVPQAPVWWGILHCMAFSLFVTHLALAHKQHQLLIFTGFIAIIISIFEKNFPFMGSWWLLPFGAPPATFRSIDYYPLAPFAALIWLTAAGGKQLSTVLHPLEQKLRAAWPGKRPLIWVGRHSFTIYLTHIPGLFVILWLMSLV